MTMRTLTVTNVAAYSLLACTATVCFLLPDSLVIERASADPQGMASNVTRLNGVVRDFKSTHTDFDAQLSEAPGHIVNLAGASIGADGKPVFSGGGKTVTTQSRDSQGRNIAPVMASYNEGVNFTIANGKVTTTEAFAVKITVVGAAMSSGSYDMPVTVKVNVGAAAINPFGDFTKAVAGNVNKAGNPREFISPVTYSANTAIYVTGRSWEKKQSSYSGTSESHWQTFYEFNTNGANQQVKVLRNGDSCPNTAGWQGQVAAKQFLAPYLNSDKTKVVLYDNQVIYLFELGTTNMSATSADFQDVVVVVTMAKSATAFNDGVSLGNGCGPMDDSLPVLGAATTAAGITSANTFQQWFTDTLGVNMSGSAPLDLVKSGDTFVFDDKTDARYSKLGGFYPADGRMLGDSGSTGHNESFTYSLDAGFTYDSSKSQYFEVTTDAEVWVFIDGKLVMDLGGFHASLNQRIDLSRLCLANGQKYTLQLFMAHRYPSPASLRVATNMQFAGSSQTTVLAPTD